MKRNLPAALVLLALLVFLPALLLGARRAQGARVIEITAMAPDAGGFSPDRLTLAAGEKVTLRIASPDVVHGFSIPELGVNVDEIYPGKPVEVTIQPAQPGRYAYACTRWCGVDHWRMRGTIEVTDGSGKAVLPSAEPPLFEQLGIDLDAMRHTPLSLPTAPPSAGRGQVLAQSGAAASVRSLGDAASRRAMSPAQAFEKLRADPANLGRTAGELWDLVAWAWLKDADADSLASAGKLYSRDCAACHGERGRGDGVAGKNLPGLSKMDPQMKAGPADFSDPGQMLSAPDALLQGKILRGGMGTGMPEFGSLYTDEQLWAMVSYLRTFLFTK